jgi:hypothetical protein
MHSTKSCAGTYDKMPGTFFLNAEQVSTKLLFGFRFN